MAENGFYDKSQLAQPGMTVRELLTFLAGFHPDTEVRLSIPVNPVVDRHVRIDLKPDPSKPTRKPRRKAA